MCPKQQCQGSVEQPTGLQEILDADERYEYKLSEILRQRTRPFLLVISADGALEHSSIPDKSPFRDQKNLDKALAHAHELFEAEQGATGVSGGQIIVDKPDERSSLLMLGGDYYSIRLFPLHTSSGEADSTKYAAVVEPIIKPLSHGVAFKRVQEEWGLSKREMDVLRELMLGSTDKEIARAVEVSVETVRAYLKSIRVKVGVATRTAIVHAVYEADSVWHRQDVSPRMM